MKCFLLGLLFVLSACSVIDPNYVATQGNAISPATAGNGRIASVGVLPHARAAASASAGSSADPNAYRLYVRMDNGLTQTVDVDTGSFMPGQRVEIRPDGRVLAF